MKFMKSKLAVLAVGAVSLFLVGKAEAKDFTVALSTYVPTASVGDFGLGGYPSISGGVRFRQLVIANAGATAQDVSIYDTCTSSTAATLALKISVPAAIATEYVPPYVVPQGVFTLTNPCIIKSATGSAVQATLLYE